MASGVYTRIISEIAKGADLESVPVSVGLVRSTSSYTFNPDHQTVSDLTGLAEPTDANYSRQVVGNVAVTVDNANNRVLIEGDDVPFGDLGGDQDVTGYFVFANIGGSDVLVGYSDDPDPRTLQGDSFTLRWPSTGIFRINV